MESADAPTRLRKRLPPEERRAQVLDVALEVFSEAGYAASMGDIGRRAGVTRTILYHYFANKEELFLAVADRLLTELLRKLAPALRSDLAMEARARLALEALMTFSEEWPDAWNILLPRGDAADAEVVAMRERVEEQMLATAADLVAPEISTVGIDLETPIGQMMARVALGGVVAGIRWWRDHPDLPAEEVAQALFDIVRFGAAGITNPGPA